MDDEKWMTASEAIELGFATKLAAARKVAAMAVGPDVLNRMPFRHLPEQLKTQPADQKDQKDQKDTASQIECDADHTTSDGANGAPPVDSSSIKEPKMADKNETGGADNLQQAAKSDEQAVKPAASANTSQAASDTAPAVGPGQKFIDAYGDAGARWFAEGKTFDEARDLHATNQAAENKRLATDNADLKVRLDAANKASGADAAADFDGDDAGDGKAKCLADLVHIGGSAGKGK